MKLVLIVTVLVLLAVPSVLATEGFNPEPVPNPPFRPLDDEHVAEFCLWLVGNGHPVTDSDTSDLRCENAQGDVEEFTLDDVCWWIGANTWPIALDTRTGIVCASRAYYARMSSRPNR